MVEQKTTTVVNPPTQPKATTMNTEDTKIEELAAQADNLIRSAQASTDKPKGKVGRPRKTPADKKAPKVEGVPHIRRAEKSAAKLPALSEAANEVLSLALGLSHEDLNAVMAHVNHKVRMKTLQDAVQLRSSAAITAGMTVRIMSGRHAGKVAKVKEVKRIRCHVTLVGGAEDRVIYLFTSEVEPVEAETVSAETEALKQAV